MKYIDEFRDGTLAKGSRRRSHARRKPIAAISLMEFCGGHTHAISRYGIKDLLPANVRWCTAPAARCACCRSAASTTRSSSPRGRA